MTTRNSCEREHDFALVLEGVNELNQGVADALYKAGCDDATVSMRHGRLYISFSREALTMKDAVVSAIQNVANANIGARVIRVDECNLVTQSDIARKISRSRQLVHQYIAGSRGPGNFPPPACHICDGSPLWYWCEVSYWLWQNDMIKEDSYLDAEAVAIINAILEVRSQQRHAPEITKEIMQELEHC